MTEAERRVWYAVRNHRFHGFGFRRQVPIGPYVADFVCHGAKLVVELDGGQHGAEGEMERDRRRTAFLERAGYRVIRFWNTEVFTEWDGVQHRLAAALGVLDPERLDTPHPDPPPQGGRGRRRRDDVPG